MIKKVKWKRIVAVCFVMVLTVVLLSPAGAVTYPDTEDHWGRELVDKWSDAGVIIGTSTFDNTTFTTRTSFNPDAALTRGEFAKILEEIFGWDKMAGNTFVDLKYAADGSTYTSDVAMYSAVLKAVAAGVMQGNSLMIRPFDDITREEACVMLCRAFSIRTKSAVTSFSDDSDISDYARAAVSTIIGAGYMTGYSDGTLRPKGAISRIQILAVLDKMIPDYEILSERLAQGDITRNYTDITVTSVPTFNSGFVETDNDGFITTEAAGSKDLIIRFWYPQNVEAGEPVPVLLYTFGGAWIMGDRSSIDPYLVKYMLEHGVAVASLTYRLETEAIYPYCMYDLQAQIRYLRINADELGINPDNLGITGPSAGGYWAAQMAVTGNEADHQDPGYVTFEGDDRSVSTELNYCGWQYGCCNMLTCFEDVDYRIHDYWENWSYHDSPAGCDPALFGTDDVAGYSAVNEATGEVVKGVSTALLRDIYERNDTDHELWWLVERFVSGSPIFWVDENDPVFFIYHGTNDPLCPVQQAIDMYGALETAGVEGNVFRLCEGMGHGSFTHPVYYLEMLQWMVDQAYTTT